MMRKLVSLVFLAATVSMLVSVATAESPEADKMKEHRAMQAEHAEWKSNHAQMRKQLAEMENHLKKHEQKIHEHEKKIIAHGKALKSGKPLAELEAHHEALKKEHQAEAAKHAKIKAALNEAMGAMKK